MACCVGRPAGCGPPRAPGSGLGAAPSPALLCGAQGSARPGLALSAPWARPGLRSSFGHREAGYRYREAAAASATFDPCGRTARPPRHPSMPPTVCPAMRAPRAGEARLCDRRWSGRTARSRSPPGRARHHSPAPSRAALASLTVGLGFACSRTDVASARVQPRRSTDNRSKPRSIRLNLH